MELPAKFKGFADSDGRITRLPVKLSKKGELAYWLLELIEPGRVYSEKEITALFIEYVDDFALMRRLLVEEGKLLRDPSGAEYRRANLDS